VFDEVAVLRGAPAERFCALASPADVEPRDRGDAEEVDERVEDVGRVEAETRGDRQRHEDGPEGHHQESGAIAVDGGVTHDHERALLDKVVNRQFKVPKPDEVR